MRRAKRLSQPCETLRCARGDKTQLVGLPGAVPVSPDAAMIVAGQAPGHADREAGWYRESNPFSSLCGRGGFFDCRWEIRG